MKTFEQKIEALKKAEIRARDLANQRYANERKWQKIMDDLRGTPEWEAYCEANGLSDDYNYGDAIA